MTFHHSLERDPYTEDVKEFGLNFTDLYEPKIVVVVVVLILLCFILFLGLFLKQ